MAKRQSETTGPSQPARVRYFELEGSDETIQKALATFERMRNPGALAVPQPRRVTSSEKPAAEPTLFEGSDEPGEDDANGVDDELQADDATSQRRKRGAGSPTDRNAGIVGVGDVDFVPSGQTPLKTFVAEKAPSTDMEYVLVICYWLEHTLAISAISPGHVLSGLRHVSKAIPKDLQQTIRNAAKNKTWLDVGDINKIRTTTVGQNVVQHEMGKSGSSKSNGDK